ncbi:MAG: PilZ domain-containing protein [Anaerovibrio sp.]|uniref:flagellar brake protein n=1 Tax=Anaerovibrio sp. TaxID=1872532 RepID=UPI0025EC7EDD|nr:flagellar brake domain-containing protein [Anaerovibrio sp.]MCR5175924.1 PilZ domain-containing protein [Anaerovibrio sp.]
MVKPTYVKASNVLKLGQRIEVLLSDDTRGYSSRIEDITDSSLILAMPVDERMIPLIISPGSRVICKAFGGRCYYLFRVEFQKKGIANIPVWYVTKPTRAEKLQYREFVRVKTTRPLVVRPVGEDGALEDMILTSTIDISGGGISFALHKPLKVDSMVTIELDNIPGIGLMQLMSRVARCSEVDSNGEKIYQIGAQFLSIDKVVQNRLVKFIFGIQRDGLAKGIDEL